MLKQLFKIIKAKKLKLFTNFNLSFNYTCANIGELIKNKIPKHKNNDLKLNLN